MTEWKSFHLRVESGGFLVDSCAARGLVGLSFHFCRPIFHSRVELFWHHNQVNLTITLMALRGLSSWGWTSLPILIKASTVRV